MSEESLLEHPQSDHTHLFHKHPLLTTAQVFSGHPLSYLTRVNEIRNAVDRDCCPSLPGRAWIGMYSWLLGPLKPSI